MIYAILLLWLALLALLLRSAHRAFRKRQTFEAALLIAAAIAIVAMTGEYALFLGWSLVCEVGSGECRL